MIRAYRFLRQLVRKAIKPICLWINECRRQESEHEVSRLDVARQEAAEMMRREHLRQVELQMKRNQIAGFGRFGAIKRAVRTYLMGF